jgi:hypothetical protein
MSAQPTPARFPARHVAPAPALAFAQSALDGMLTLSGATRGAIFWTMEPAAPRLLASHRITEECLAVVRDRWRDCYSGNVMTTTGGRFFGWNGEGRAGLVVYLHRPEMEALPYRIRGVFLGSLLGLLNESRSDPAAEERASLRAALRDTRWNYTEASKRLGVSRSTLYRRFKGQQPRFAGARL